MGVKLKKKSTTGGPRKWSGKGLSKAMGSIGGRASSEYMKYGDINKVSDVDTQTTVSGARGSYDIGDFNPALWASRLVDYGGRSAGDKFRKDGKTYKIRYVPPVPPASGMYTADEVKT